MKLNGYKSQLFGMLLNKETEQYSNEDEGWKLVLNKVGDMGVSYRNDCGNIGSVAEEKEGLRRKIVEVLQLEDKVFDFEIMNEVVFLKREVSRLRGQSIKGYTESDIVLLLILNMYYRQFYITKPCMGQMILPLLKT